MLFSCTFDRSGVPFGDFQGYHRDTLQSLDAATELPQQPDAAPLQLDALPVDLPIVDLPIAQDSYVPTCKELYSTVAFFVFQCLETPTECRFYFSNFSPYFAKSCDQICAATSCIKAEANNNYYPYCPANSHGCGRGGCTCQTIMINGICTCSRY